MTYRNLNATRGRKLQIAAWVSAPLLCLSLASGCNNQHSSVEKELEDLKAARSNVAEEVDELRDELAESKDRVQLLKAKLARARQGLTDEVIEERQELAEALEQTKKRAVEEASEARDVSQELRSHGQEATQELNQVQQLEAQVDGKTPLPPQDAPDPVLE